MILLKDLYNYRYDNNGYNFRWKSNNRGRGYMGK